jgi:hypothetical protein
MHFLTKIDIFERRGSKGLILSVEKNAFFRHFLFFFAFSLLRAHYQAVTEVINIRTKNQGSRGGEFFSVCACQK